MSWRITLRHFIRNWRLNLVLGSVMALGAALLAGLPMLAAAIAGESLAGSLAAASIQDRNLLIQGESEVDELPEEVRLALGRVLLETVSVREGDLTGVPVIFKPGGEHQDLHPATLVLNLRSFDRLADLVQVVDGRLPAAEPLDSPLMPNAAHAYEAVVGVQAAGRMGLALGDEFSSAGGTYSIRVVGIVEPRQPASEVWWGDRQLLVFSAWRRIFISPDIDEWNVSLLVHPRMLAARAYHKHYWRLLLDREAITTSNMASLGQNLTGLQSQLTEQDFVLGTGLFDLIARFEQALSLAQVSLLLLTCQSLIAVFYLLGMIGGFLVEQSWMEITTLSGRGFSRLQITGIFARQVGLMAAASGLVSPFLARWALSLWANWQGYPAPVSIPVTSWQLALAAGASGWVVLVLAVYRSTRPGVATGQGQVARPAPGTLTRRNLVWDIFILTLGGLAYWQLLQGGEVARQGGQSAGSALVGISDPVLLLGPTMLLLAAGLILIRTLPVVWRLFAWSSRRGRGLLWTMGFARLARQPVGPSQVTLLIGLTAGLTLFASAFTTSIGGWQDTMARFVEGADIRIRRPMTGAEDAGQLGQAVGAAAGTSVIRSQVTVLLDEFQRLDFDLLAVDPAVFPAVAAYPPGVSSFSIAQIMGVLGPDSATDYAEIIDPADANPHVLPVVISSNPYTRHLDIGAPLEIEIGDQTLPAVVTGIILEFPLLEDVFLVTDLARFAQAVDLEMLGLMDRSARETWLAVDPGAHETVLAALAGAGLADAIVGDAGVRLADYRNNLVFREVSAAFELNALVLLPLSGMGFLLIQLFTARRRAGEFKVLQAIGLSRTQLRSLLFFEGVMFIALGLLIGFGVGYGLVVLTRPFLAQILPPLGGEYVLSRLWIAPVDLGVRFAVLVIFYGIGLAVLAAAAVRRQPDVQI